VWDVATGRELLTLGTYGGAGLFPALSGGVYVCGFSANGSQLAAVADDGRVQVWDGTPGG
jgi:WD40 repeat protein